MRYGISLPNGGECATPQFLLELTALAEEADWEGIFLEDYICYTNDAYPVAAPPTIDPWVALAALALQTKRVLLGTMVTPLPRRRPWKLAREAASVDALSQGRLIVGVGSGDVREPGFSHVGEERDAKRRAELLDEGLAILAGLWRGEPFSYQGTHYRVDEVAFLCRPVQQPRIPIWVGGGWLNKGSVQRALCWDGAILYKEGDARRTVAGYDGAGGESAAGHGGAAAWHGRSIRYCGRREKARRGLAARAGADPNARRGGSDLVGRVDTAVRSADDACSRKTRTVTS